MSRHSIYDRETCLCEFSAKCNNPSVKQGTFGGGACLEHEQAFLEKKKARNKKASINRRDRDDAMSSLGLTKVKSVSGKVYYE
jgi:hypothetical protein